MDLGTLSASLVVNTRGVAQAEVAMRSFKKNVMNSLRDIQKQLDVMSSNMGKMAAPTQEAGAVIEKSAKEAGEAISKLDDQSSKSFKNMQNSIQHAAMTMRSFGWLATTTLTLPIMAGGKSVLNAFKEFEFSMTKITALVGISKEQINEWSGSVRDMAKAIGKPATEVAETLYFVTSSGFQTAAALDIVNIATKAAAVGLGDAKEIADLTTSVMNAYGQGNISAARTVDILVAAVREGKGEADEYAKSLGSVVPFAAQLGVKFEEVAGSVAAMTLEGASAANAATYLRNVFMRLIKPAAQSEQALRAMGSSTLELRHILREKGVLASLMKIRELTDKYGDELMGKVIPNIRALLAELMLTGENFEYNTKVIDATTKSAGDLARAYQAVYGSLETRTQRFTAQFKDSMIELGKSIHTAVMPVLENLGRHLENITKWFSALDEASQRSAVSVASFLVAVGPVALIVSTVTFGLKGLFNILKKAGAILVGVKDLIMFGSTSAPILTAAVKALKTSVSTLWGALYRFSELGFIVSMITGLYKVTIGYSKKVIEAAKANDVFQKTLINVNGEIKKLSDVTIADWPTMDYESVMKWNLWAEKSIKNTKEWIAYSYQLAGVSKEKAIQYTETLAKGAEASESELKEANKAMGRWKQQIGIYQIRLREALEMYEETKEALGDKLTEFSTLVTPATTEDFGFNLAFGLKEVGQAIEYAKVQLNQLQLLEKGYDRLGVKGYDFTTEKVGILNDALVQLIENGWGASDQAKWLAGEIQKLGGLSSKAGKEITKLADIQEKFRGKLEALQYMSVNMREFGLEFDYVNEKVKLVKSTLEDMIEHKGADTEFARELAKMLENMEPNVYSLTKAWKEFNEEVKFTEEKAKIVSKSDFGFNQEMLKASEAYLDKLLKIKVETKNLEKATVSVGIGIPGGIPMSISVLDVLNGMIKETTDNIEKYKDAIADEEMEKLIRFLNLQAESFGGVDIQIDILNAKLRRQETILRKLSDAGKEHTQEWWDAVDSIIAYRSEIQRLEQQSQLRYMQDSVKSFRDLDALMGFLNGKIRMLEDSFEQLSKSGKGTPDLLRSMAKEIKHLERLQKFADGLLGVFTDLFNSISDGADAMVESLISSFQSMLARLLAELAVFAILKLLFKDQMQGVSALDFLLGQARQQQQQIPTSDQPVYSVAKGGIVPSGFPNDTFPAWLTSGEIVLPREQYEKFAPLSKLAKTGTVSFKEFFDSPMEKFHTMRIPKLRTGGIIPEGFPNDSFLARLSSKEVVMPSKKYKEFLDIPRSVNRTLKKLKQQERSNIESVSKSVLNPRKLNKLAKSLQIKEDPALRKRYARMEKYEKTAKNLIVNIPEPKLPPLQVSDSVFRNMNNQFGESHIPSRVMLDVPKPEIPQFERAGTNVHITLDGTVSGRDLALIVRRIEEMN